MSDTEYDRIPPLTLGLRLKMALEWADHSNADVAAELGVSVSTVSRWMNNKDAPPPRGMIKAWADFTHCDFQWLLTGDQPPDGGPVELDAVEVSA